MTKNALLKRLEAAMTDAERSRIYGHIEIEICNREATVLRKLTTERLEMENKFDVNHFNR